MTVTSKDKEVVSRAAAISLNFKSRSDEADRQAIQASEHNRLSSVDHFVTAKKKFAALEARAIRVMDRRIQRALQISEAICD